MGKPTGEWVTANGAMANGHWLMGNGHWAPIIRQGPRRRGQITGRARAGGGATTGGGNHRQGTRRLEKTLPVIAPACACPACGFPPPALSLPVVAPACACTHTVQLRACCPCS